MEDYFNAHKGFNCEKFEAERFGVGREKMGFCSWGDVAHYFGISATVHANERHLRSGNMSAPMYDCLSRLYGQESMAEYFPKPPAPPKPTAGEKYVDDIAVLYGSLADVAAWRARQK